jgi:hypothetical protein
LLPYRLLVIGELPDNHMIGGEQSTTLWIGIIGKSLGEAGGGS